VSDGGVERKVSIPPAQLANLDIERGIGPFGLSPLRLTTRLAYIEAGSAADRAGLRTDDTVLAVNGVALDGDWTRLVTAVLHSGGKSLALTVEHSGAAPRTVSVTPQRATPDGPWRLGIAPAPDADWMNGLQFRRDPGLLGGIGEAFAQTWQSVSLTTRMIGRMLTGDVSPASISGPITMADYAGKSARAGWEAFLDYMALISISLGVLNLLPIPLLDGGHLLYYAAEIIRGRPLSARAQEVGRRIGFSALAALMLFAFFNDITRLFAG
ncbi:MAG: RIP metalloprotease RseP, partial [Microvirgula sp.]